jgi:fumarylacetoacetase
MSTEHKDKKQKMSDTVNKSWIPYTADCDFPIENLPYGIFQPTANDPARVGVAIGDQILDLSIVHVSGMFAALGSWTGCFAKDTLNEFMAMGPANWNAARTAIAALLKADCPTLRDNAAVRAKAMVPQASAVMRMPCTIGDYTDFYASREHATNVGTMFRGAENALMPNWTYLPVGYHGRASSVVVSGTPVRRPRGQLQKNRDNAKEGSVFGPCKLMDFELEMGCLVGPGNELGNPIKIEEADNHVFGFVILNDWSARDIQKWEYVPLGPFTAKNVASSISPWVVTTEALRPFKCKTSAGVQEPKPHPYLQDPNYGSYDIQLSVTLKNDTDIKEPAVISRSNFKYMYWNHKQQLVHHTVTGCNMRPGDLLGSGTISGSDRSMFGSMLELCWKGTKEIDCGNNGTIRKFLKDGDEVIMSGHCQGQGYRVGFGSVTGKILPAHTD